MRKSHRTLDCVLITTLIFFVLVGIDIAVVESIFSPFGLWKEIWMWHMMFGTLVIVLPLAVAIRTQTHLPLYIPLLVAFGLEDTTFYSLQLKLPTYYVGVSILGIWEPKRDIVLILNLLAVFFVVIIELFYRVSHFSRHLAWKGLRRSAIQIADWRPSRSLFRDISAGERPWRGKSQRGGQEGEILLGGFVLSRGNRQFNRSLCS